MPISSSPSAAFYLRRRAAKAANASKLSVAVAGSGITTK